ncbi:MAG: hypothetical protein PHC91_07160 [Eubacteriales bacterium]|nr:hypothetical protein [Eubacteriales bacterium]
MKENKKIQVGIGFATGRKGFQKVLRSYIYNWKESGLVDNKNMILNLFIAYDLSYANTKATDFIKIHPELDEQINSKTFIGNNDMKNQIDELVLDNIITREEAGLLFGKGYAAKRNAVLYFAIKNKMTHLLFLDDDEYPVAVTNTKKTAIWGGQHVLSKHLEYLDEADITHGRHCGYISPIPFIEYNKVMKESDFRTFIEAISNDILNWDRIKKVMEDGGVTYADPQVLTGNYAFEVQEQHHSKFISGSNLGINLKDPRRIYPFYNPPGARGEDTFLSTCLSQRKVMRVPCYTFHDGFSTYNHLLEGVLPIHLKYIKAEDERIIARFYKACLGWVRYKPLLTYITRPEAYEATIKEMRRSLGHSVPKICEYFRQPDFMNVIVELNNYHNEVEKHNLEFQAAKKAWSKIMDHLSSSNQNVLPSCSLLITPKRAL